MWKPVPMLLMKSSIPKPSKICTQYESKCIQNDALDPLVAAEIHMLCRVRMSNRKFVSIVVIILLTQSNRAVAPIMPQSTTVNSNAILLLLIRVLDAPLCSLGVPVLEGDEAVSAATNANEVIVETSPLGKVVRLTTRLSTTPPSGV